MKTKSLLSAIAVVVLSTSVGYAQRVEPAPVDGHPVINCEAMLASAYTTTKKGNTEMLLKTATANEKVYKRFAVHNSNNSTSSNWSNAFTVCSGISGGLWRPPTQRELMLIWVLHPELKKTSGFLPFDTTNYGGATEASSSLSWSVNFTNGNSSNVNKALTTSVRCIREL